MIYTSASRYYAARNKKILTALVLAVLFGIALYIFWPYLPWNREVIVVPKDKNIIAFGDSLTVGVGASEDHDYVTLLSQKIGRPIINKGVSGDTTESALKRLDDVINSNPGLVVIMLGGNDILWQIPAETTFTNLEQMIVKLKGKGAIVILVGIQNGIFTDTYGGKFQELADKTGAVYVANILRGIIGHDELMYDAIHPNDNGYAIVADKLYAVVKKFIPE